MKNSPPAIVPTPPNVAALDRLGDEIAELSALADPDAPGEAVLEDGAHVSAETSRRLACDASRVVMRHGGAGRYSIETGEWRADEPGQPRPSATPTARSGSGGRTGSPISPRRAERYRVRLYS